MEFACRLRRNRRAHENSYSGMGCIPLLEIFILFPFGTLSQV